MSMPRRRWGVWLAVTLWLMPPLAPVQPARCAAPPATEPASEGLASDEALAPAPQGMITTGAAEEPEELAAKGPHGMALCLSGGGYRAMLFHVGMLWRLNELGYLPKLDRISSVSGGSITAGALAVAWSGLRFDARGVATNFNEQFVTPVLRMADTNVDVIAALIGFIPGLSASCRVEAEYRKHLFGHRTLQDLPDRPEFVFDATNQQSGVLWRFLKRYMADYRVGVIKNPRVELAVAVAASSAFPPVLSPVRLKLKNSDFVPGSGTKELQRPPFTTDVFLVDGGVYDNLGLEPVWKDYETILVSDGGQPFSPDPKPTAEKLGQTLRVLNIIQSQVRALRTRTLVGSYFKSGARKGAYWGIATKIASYKVPGALPCPPEKTDVLARYPTRLAKVPEAIQQRLINWGYAICDAAMRAFVDKTAPPPAGFPYPAQGVG
jgi:NTE family protein